MNNKEFKKIEKEMKEWQEFKERIRKQVNIIDNDNYDEDSFIFRILKINNKKDKNEFVSIIKSFEEDIFLNTFNAMSEYFENTLRKNYVFIEDISMFQNLFGIIKDRIKSNEEYIKMINKNIKKMKKEIIDCKDYDKQVNLKYDLWREEESIKEYNKNIDILNRIYRQLKLDIKKTEIYQNKK